MSPLTKGFFFFPFLNIFPVFPSDTLKHAVLIRFTQQCTVFSYGSMVFGKGAKCKNTFSTFLFMVYGYE